MITASSLDKRIADLLDRAKAEEESHIKYTEYGVEIYDQEDTRVYVPSNTGSIFHSDDTFVRCVMGPYGSGKSTLCINEIVKRTCTMPRWSNNRRRSRWAIVRNTSGELQTTTLQTWLAWFGSLGDIYKRQKPILTYEHTFNDGEGVIELELLFLALDRPDDIRKIKSLELTGCYINELSEVPKAALDHMKGRVGRYPGPNFCNDSYWYGVISDTNPPDDDHWIYHTFEEKILPEYKMFKQPTGLIKDEEGKWITNPNADNIKNLPVGYYEKMASGQTEEFIKVFCRGIYGSVGTGKRVYPEYNDDMHSIDEIQPIAGELIHLGWDGGLTPACVVIQITPRGQLLILKEYCAEDMGIRTFAESIVLPGLARDFPTNKIGKSVADPACIKRDEIMEELSFIGELNSLGIETIPARTNNPDTRISAVRYFLNGMVDGKPRMQVSRKGAPIIRKGFNKDYVYKRLAVPGEERYRNVPDKNRASHPHDATQYICLEFAAESIVGSKIQPKAIDIFNPIMRTF